MPSRIIAWNIVRMMGMGYKAHPKISGALKRRRTFVNLDLVFRGYRSRDVFRYINNENLRAYIEGITKSHTEGGFGLAYSSEWEAYIYMTGLRDMDLWRG
jgi:hypothetical protein